MSNKNPGEPEERHEVPGADEEKQLSLTIPWNLASDVRIFLESLYVNATQIRNKWDCRKNNAQSERRDICGRVAINSGQI